MLNPERNHHLDNIVKEFMGVDINAHDESKAVTLSLFDDAPEESVTEGDKYAEVSAIWKVAPMVYEALDSMKSVYDTIEEPLARVLFEMERNGVRIDVSVHKGISGRGAGKFTEEWLCADVVRTQALCSGREFA